MFVVDWLERLTSATFAEPTTALLVGIVIGGIIGYAIASSGGARMS